MSEENKLNYTFAGARAVGENLDGAVIDVVPAAAPLTATPAPTLDGSLDVLKAGVMRDLANITGDVITSEEFGEKVGDILGLMEKLDALKKDITSAVKKVLKEKYDTDSTTCLISKNGIRFTYIPGSMRETVDKTKLEKEFPEVAAAVIKKSVVSESVRITKEKKKAGPAALEE